MNWTPQTKIGVAILVIITLTCIALLGVDHSLAPAWAMLGQVVQVAARMAGAGA
jgi:hypothetical protein